MPEPVAADRSAAGRLAAIVTSREFKFLLVGGFNTLFGLALFLAFHAMLGDRLPYLAILVLTYAFGVVVAFTTQRVFVFQVKGQIGRDLPRFVLVQVSALAANAALLTLLVEASDVPVALAQVISLIVIVIGTYFGHLLFSFRRPEGDS